MAAQFRALPDYDDLPRDPDGRPIAWRLFGENDNVGLVNLMTPERIVAAARLIRRGASFALDLPIDAFDPPLASTRSSTRRTFLHEAGSTTFDDVLDNFYPQVSSQIDSLAHVGIRSDAFYNGATEAQIRKGERNGIDHLARRGIVGRAVLFDIPRALAAAGRKYHPGTRFEISTDELEIARRHANVELEPGDVLLLHTGFCKWYLSEQPQVQARVRAKLDMPGLAADESVCRYLWNAHVAVVAADNYAVEAWLPDRSDPQDKFNFLHTVLIGQFGMTLGELWWLSDLAADCAEDGIYEMFIASVPLHVRGGIGSPPNVMVLK